MNTKRKTTVIRGQRSEVRGQPDCPSSRLRPKGFPLRSKSFGGQVGGQAVVWLQDAFTLVELLVVISIMAILLGIIVPSYFSIREKAKYTKAKVTTKNLETAFKAYLDHYRVWPAAFVGPGGAAKEIDENIVNILKGDPSAIAGNKDSIAFYEFETTNSADGALDPWSDPYDPPATWKTYRVQVDHDYDNKIGDLYRTVIVWSVGTNRSDLITEPATKEGNIKSWD